MKRKKRGEREKKLHKINKLVCTDVWADVIGFLFWTFNSFSLPFAIYHYIFRIYITQKWYDDVLNNETLKISYVEHFRYIHKYGDMDGHFGKL